MNRPVGVSVDISGNVYIADHDNNNIRKVSSTGIITTFAGTGSFGSNGDGGAATSAQLNGPVGVSVHISGNVYIADSGNNKIRMVTSTGIITTIAGTGVRGSTGDGGAATSAQLSDPLGVSADIHGNLYIVDWDCKIRMLGPSVPTYLPTLVPTPAPTFLTSSPTAAPITQVNFLFSRILDFIIVLPLNYCVIISCAFFVSNMISC